DFGAVRVAVGPVARIARMNAARAVRACVGAVAEEPVVARRAIGIGRGAGLELLAARLGAVGIVVGPCARAAGMMAAGSVRTGVGPVAENSVVAGRSVRIGIGASRRSAVAARFRAVGVSVAAGTLDTDVYAAFGEMAFVGAVACKSVVAVGAFGVRAGARIGDVVACLRTIVVAVRSVARVAGVRAARAGHTGVRAVAELSVVARRAGRIVGGARVVRLVARLRAIGITIRARARIAGVLAAASVRAAVGAVAEFRVVAGGPVRIAGGARFCLLAAAFRAIAISVRSPARIARVNAARSVRAGIGAVAEDPVVARAAVRVRPRAPAGSVAARLGAVRIAVGAGALDAGMLRAESRRAAAVGAIAEQAVVARRSLGFALAAGRAAIAAGGVAVVALLADLDHVISAVGLEEADVQEIAVELLAAVRRYADVVLAGRQPVLQPRAQR